MSLPIEALESLQKSRLVKITGRGRSNTDNFVASCIDRFRARSSLLIGIGCCSDAEVVRFFRELRRNVIDIVRFKFLRTLALYPLRQDQCKHLPGASIRCA